MMQLRARLSCDPAFWAQGHGRGKVQDVQRVLLLGRRGGV
jgi:hypothetical protein